jgi:hypothetical protein
LKTLTRSVSTLLESEKQCSIPNEGYWSEKLHQTNLIYQYWVILLTGKKNNLNVQEQLQNITNKVPIDAKMQSESTRHHIKQLQHARKELINVRIHSFQH